MNTGKLVRASVHEKIVITDRGHPVALLKNAEAAELVGKPFPKRDRRKMPRSTIDSTIYVSEDRDAR
jgi:antitoxin (DNA-binding transcriptional repressor) of toxin-antitoxin stability system